MAAHHLLVLADRASPVGGCVSPCGRANGSLLKACPSRSSLPASGCSDSCRPVSSGGNSFEVSGLAAKLVPLSLFILSVNVSSVPNNLLGPEPTRQNWELSLSQGT